jgi:hypothetical protein
MADDGGPQLQATSPDPLTPELAPFVVQARAHLEQATDGLDHDATVEHLEATLARAEVAASRLGFSLPAPEPATEALSIGDGSVVLVQRVSDLG